MSTELDLYDPGALPQYDNVEGLCHTIVTWAQGIDDLGAVLEGRARLDALAAYLDNKRKQAWVDQVPVDVAQRRIKVRIGQLLGPAVVGSHSSASEGSDLTATERSAFRFLAARVDTVEELLAQCEEGRVHPPGGGCY